MSCSICWEKPANMLFSNCYHLSICDTCSLTYGSRTCCICRSENNRFIKVYIPDNYENEISQKKTNYEELSDKLKQYNDKVKDCQKQVNDMHIIYKRVQSKYDKYSTEMNELEAKMSKIVNYNQNLVKLLNQSHKEMNIIDLRTQLLNNLQEKKQTTDELIAKMKADAIHQKKQANLKLESLKEEMKEINESIYKQEEFNDMLRETIKPISKKQKKQKLKGK